MALMNGANDIIIVIPFESWDCDAFYSGATMQNIFARHLRAKRVIRIIALQFAASGLIKTTK